MHQTYFTPTDINAQRRRTVRIPMGWKWEEATLFAVGHRTNYGKLGSVKFVCGYNGQLMDFDKCLQDYFICDDLFNGILHAIDKGIEDETLFITGGPFDEETINIYQRIWYKLKELGAKATQAVIKAKNENRIIYIPDLSIGSTFIDTNRYIYNNFKEWRQVVAEIVPTWRVGWWFGKLGVERKDILLCNHIEEVYDLFRKDNLIIENKYGKDWKRYEGFRKYLKNAAAI